MERVEFLRQSGRAFQTNTIDRRCTLVAVLLAYSAFTAVMLIRQQISYNGHTGRMCGSVDLGNNEDTDDEAKEVLVFMLVGLQGHWKVPVAYFFTKTLTALTQKELVVHVLEELAAG